MDTRSFKNSIYKEIASITKALGNPHRLEILDLLAQGPAPVEYIAEHTDLTVGNASQHLQVLKNARLVDAERKWKYNYYSLANQNVFETWCSLRRLGYSQNAELKQKIEDYRRDRKSLRIISPLELMEKMKNQEVIVLDVRPEEEYNIAHIVNAISLPQKDLEKRLNELPEDMEIVVYCRGPLCLAADESVLLLKKRGFNASRLEKGFPDWAAQNLPIEKAG
ncbi:MAG: ArsR family transcriptional regulator [Balneolaceae bacterium]|nr:MAG: ArsR family transcriptional regulator [Balneolaceae bacterium]